MQQLSNLDKPGATARAPLQKLLLARGEMTQRSLKLFTLLLLQGVLLWRRVSIFFLGKAFYWRKREDGRVPIAIKHVLSGDFAQPDKLLVRTQLGCQPDLVQWASVEPAGKPLACQAPAAHFPEVMRPI